MIDHEKHISAKCGILVNHVFTCPKCLSALDDQKTQLCEMGEVCEDDANQALRLAINDNFDFG